MVTAPPADPLAGLRRKVLSSPDTALVTISLGELRALMAAADEAHRERAQRKIADDMLFRRAEAIHRLEQSEVALAAEVDRLRAQIDSSRDLLPALERSLDWLASYPGEGALDALVRAWDAIGKARLESPA